MKFAPAISSDPRLRNFTISRLVTYSSLSHWMGKSSRQRVCFLQPLHCLHLSLSGISVSGISVSGISVSGQQCGHVVLVGVCNSKLFYVYFDTINVSGDQDVNLRANSLAAELPVSDRESLPRALDVLASCVGESSGRADSGAHRTLADTGAVIAHVAFHHLVDFDTILRNAKWT